jgi:hypothetical protein
MTKRMNYLQFVHKIFKVAGLSSVLANDKDGTVNSQVNKA